MCTGSTPILNGPCNLLSHIGFYLELTQAVTHWLFPHSPTNATVVKTQAQVEIFSVTKIIVCSFTLI